MRPPMLQEDPIESAEDLGAPPLTLYEIDEGRARRGLSIIALCALFWIGVAWLLLRMF